MKKRIVFLEKTEPEYLLLESVDGCGDLLQQDLAQKRLLRRAKRENYPYYYQIGAMYSRRVWMPETGHQASLCFCCWKNR